jgi:hypothetical protein
MGLKKAIVFAVSQIESIKSTSQISPYTTFTVTHSGYISKLRQQKEVM